MPFSWQFQITNLPEFLNVVQIVCSCRVVSVNFESNLVNFETNLDNFESNLDNFESNLDNLSNLDNFESNLDNFE